MKIVFNWTESMDKMKKILIAALLVSSMDVYGSDMSIFTELETIERFMKVGQFEKTCTHLHALISTPGASDENMHAYACIAALNHIILKKPEDAAVFMELANSLTGTPNFSFENRYLHFLAKHAHTPNQTTFNNGIVELATELQILSQARQEFFSKKIKPFLNICTNNIEPLDDAFIYAKTTPDELTKMAHELITRKEYVQAWNVFKERIKETASDAKREKMTKLLQEHRSSLFQSFITSSFEASDYETAGILSDMLMAPGERHSSARLSGLIFYALNNTEKLKAWVGKIAHEVSNPKELTLPTEIWLDQAFCIVTAHHLYQHLKITNTKMDNFYKHVMKNIDQETSVIWEACYTDFMEKIESLNKEKEFLAKKAEEELLKEFSSASVSAASTSSGKKKKSKKVQAPSTDATVIVAQTPVVSQEEKEQSRLANIVHQAKLAEQARNTANARKKHTDDARRGLERKAEKDARKHEEKIRIAAIEREKQSLPPLEFTIDAYEKGVTLTSGTPGLWLPIQKYKKCKQFCNPSTSPLNALGFIHEGIFHPL